MNKKLYFNLSIVYLNLKEYYNSIEYLLKAIKLDNKYLAANINLGIVYKRLNLFTKSKETLEYAITLNPNDIDIYYNLANTLSSMEKYEESLKNFDIVLQLDKNYSKAYYGQGLVYNNLLNFKQAFKLFQKALQLNPKDKDALFAISLIQLRFKNFQEGWKNYEARWDANNPLEKVQYKVNFYNGEDLRNKIILIQEEQGFGDNIQFIRYIKHLKTKNPKIIYVAVRDTLTKLFKLIDGIKVVNNTDVLSHVDYFTSLLSLPKIFNTTFETIPNTVPYLPIPKKDKISRKVIQNTKKLKVGFAYQGNKEHSNDKYRSIQLEVFKSLFELEDIEFYSLQIGYDDKQFEKLKDTYSNVYECNSVITNFYDSAIIVNKLDIIVSIDSALAHFAGALNKKVFILLPKNVEWRWLENIDYSPWYPSAKLFRQKVLGLWGDTIEEVKKELISF
jgi:tetratricopeptide (TPR) repeat protein